MYQPYFTHQDLLQGLSAGDTAAFNQLFSIHWIKVYKTAFLLIKSKDLAEDITQDVFLKLWETRNTISAIQNLDSFLFVTTRNLTFNRMRRMKTESAYLNYLLSHQVLEDEATTDLAEFRELNQIVNQAIRLLPPQQQKAFRLSRERGLTHDQIAQEMSVSTDSVKSYIVRAMGFLKKYLTEHAVVLVTALMAQLNK